MSRLFAVKPAEELLDREFIAKWRDRRAIDPEARSVLRVILDRFVADGEPVRVSEFPPETHEAIARLDEKDLIFVQNGQVRAAYPFSSTPTAFRVVTADGGDRYAVCAIDALGVAPLLGQPVMIHTPCHHCGAPLDLSVRPEGPVGDAEVMVWVGERGDLRQKAATSLWLTLNFFRSEEHLARWREAHREVPGSAAVLAEAFKVAAKIFGELLREL